jgi:hypothetical protein
LGGADPVWEEERGRYAMPSCNLNMPRINVVSPLQGLRSLSSGWRIDIGHLEGTEPEMT